MVTKEQARSIVSMYSNLEILENMASDPAVTFSKNEGHAMDMAREALEDKFHMAVDCAVDDIEMDMARKIEDSVNKIMDSMRHEYGDPYVSTLFSHEMAEKLFDLEHDLATFMAHWLLNEIC